jgi:hypothetical protein
MAIAGEGSGLWIIDVVGIHVHVVGGMRADGGDGASALDAALVWVLYSSERKVEEVEEVGNDGWAPSGGECEDGDEPHPYRDVRQGRGPFVGLAGWATSHAVAMSV